MKKPTNRIHRKGATSAAPVQVKTKTPAFDNAWAAWRKLAASVRAKNPERIPQAA
jgi:hypothetical protein